MTRVPRVASYYEHRLGRNDGNPLYVTYVMKRDYIATSTLQYDHLLPDPRSPQPGPGSELGEYDLYLWVDWAEDALRESKNGGTPLLPYDPVKCPSPSMYWVSDTHLGWDYRHKKAGEFDYVMAAQRNAAMALGAEYPNKHVEWLPHAVEPDTYNPAGIFAKTPEQRELVKTAVTTLKPHDVSFVGYLTFPHRLDFLDDVFKRCGEAGLKTWYCTRFFEEAAKIYNQSKIVLNHCVNQDINMRLFEALATRSFVLTPWVPDIDVLFQDGVHLALYDDGDPKDCAEKIRYWLSRPDSVRDEIAENGYREVLSKHTIAHRVRRMLEVGGIVNGNVQ